MKVSISICPTDLEVGSEGDVYDEAALLEALREFIEARLGKLAEIVCLQVGHRQGDKWARIDGDEEAGAALLADFFEDHGADEDLFVTEPEPIDVELAEADETIRTRAIDDLAGVEHPAMQAACQAYHAAVAAALADDPRAARFNVCPPKGQRRLHSQWCGAHFKWTRGAIGVMSGELTEDEKAAISAADDAGRAAAKDEVDAEDAAGVSE
jgi:hypothetical protein